jgi:hypothetical protein
MDKEKVGGRRNTVDRQRKRRRKKIQINAKSRRKKRTKDIGRVGRRRNR